jgi:hypothetical protein
MGLPGTRPSAGCVSRVPAFLEPIVVATVSLHGRNYDEMRRCSLLVRAVGEESFPFLSRSAWSGSRRYGSEIEADAPLERIPLYIRAGRALPIRP